MPPDHRPATRPLPELIVAAAWLLVPTAVLCAYWGVWRHALTWDDHWYLPALLEIGINELPRLWQSPFALSANYWRPLPLSLFWLEAQTGIGAPLHHSINLALHLANTCLVLALASHLTRADNNADTLRTRAIAPTVALLYGLHPALVESTAWISGRFDLLATFLLLGALLLDARLRGHPSRPWLVATLFLLAALTKEMTAAFVPVLILWHLACRETPKTNWREELAATARSGDACTVGFVIGAGLAYLSLRHAALGYLLQAQGHALELTHPIDRLILPAMTTAGYFELMLFPFFSISPQHVAQLPLGLTKQNAWLGIALWCAMAGLAGRAGTEPGKRHAGTWLTLAAFASLTPVLHFLPLRIGETFVAERFLTLPLALAALALATVLASPSVIRIGRAGAVLTAAWLSVALVTTTLTVPNWQNNRALWHWAAEVAPESTLARANLIDLYKGRGRSEQGIRLVAETLAIAKPEHLPVFFNDLAEFFIEQGEWAQAEAILLQAIARLDDLSPSQRPAAMKDIFGTPRAGSDVRHSMLINLGLAREALGKKIDAEKAYLLSIVTFPKAVRGYFQMGNLSAARGNHRAAIAYYTRVTEIGGSGEFKTTSMTSDHYFVAESERRLAQLYSSHPDSNTLSPSAAAPRPLPSHPVDQAARQRHLP